MFGVKSFTIVSQRFHNERGVYLAEHLGLDSHDIVAYNAVSPTSMISKKTYLREYFARVKVFVDIIIGKDPICLNS